MCSTSMNPSPRSCDEPRTSLMSIQQRAANWLRNWFCGWFHGGGHIDHDERSVYWQCCKCKRVVR
jgi:hypothetical protein